MKIYVNFFLSYVNKHIHICRNVLNVIRPRGFSRENKMGLKGSRNFIFKPKIDTGRLNGKIPVYGCYNGFDELLLKRLVFRLLSVFKRGLGRFHFPFLTNRISKAVFFTMKIPYGPKEERKKNNLRNKESISRLKIGPGFVF